MMSLLLRIQRRALVPSLRGLPATAFRRLKRQIEAEALRRLARALYGDAAEVAVAAGPFAGLVLANDPRRLLLPKALGHYEQELHPTLAALSERAYGQVVNVGCAEGYYAVGLARLLPQAEVLAVDIDRAARESCRALAQRNGVAARVRVTAEAPPPLPPASGRSLWVVDCEGCEDSVLTGRPAGDFAATDMIVECHDFAVPGVTDRLRAQFTETHRIETVVQAGRDPNAVPALASCPEATRWLALCEFRPEPMHWLILRAHV